MWITRTLEALLLSPPASLGLFPVWLLLGARQVGKSSLLLRCATKDRQLVNLDDLSVRTRATRDPTLFARDLKPPLLIDEIQYAPQLLSAVKQIADRGVPPRMRFRFLSSTPATGRTCRRTGQHTPSGAARSARR